MSPRLEPVDAPRGLLLRAAYRYSKHALGKVMAPLRVVYARAPAVARPSFALARTVERKLSLEPGLRLLVQAQASALNGCGFCLDLKHATAVQHGVGLEKLEALPDHRESGLFSDRERAALDYTGEITRSRRVSDATFDRLREHFSEREIVELTFANAVENFHNLIGVPLGLESDGLCAIAERRAALRPRRAPRAQELRSWSKRQLRRKRD